MSKKVAMTSKITKSEIDDIITTLITHELCINQNFTSLKPIGSNNIVSWGQINDLSIVMKNVEYEEIYESLDREANYNFKLIDGSLVQMMYKFNNREELISHRLGYFPSINLYSYEDNPEIYDVHDLYADILKKNTLPTIFRFDYDEDPELYVELDHAKCHATFGQFENCRIPVSGPISPKKFVDFIFRYFYHKAMKHYNLNFKCENQLLETITDDERNLIHFNFN
ncbi:DUF2290 domain-containing protein [Exiguobacterium sp. s127]|uniref:DUF2290 domain-containing protein n=1 Tax=Exiguobacterium sp. s127 TaxID=2751210 RepID=UPI0020373B65|nr:DUF2290 domain-containing protein [Exiguobacterium sp. s127]